MAEYIIDGKEYMEGCVGDPISFIMELVRCKDCKYGKPLLDEDTLDKNTIKYAHLIECHKMHDWCTDNIECHDRNWFCPDGERRTDNA